jgi:hypothetical protein
MKTLLHLILTRFQPGDRDALSEFPKPFQRFICLSEGLSAAANKTVKTVGPSKRDINHPVETG